MSSTRITVLVAAALVGVIAIPSVAVLALDRAARGRAEATIDDVARAATEAGAVAADATAFAAIAAARQVSLWLVDPGRHAVLRAAGGPPPRSDLGVASLGMDRAAVAQTDERRAAPADREQVTLALASGRARGCAVLGEGSTQVCSAAERLADGRVVLAERVSARVSTRLLDAGAGLIWLVAIAALAAAVLAIWLVRRIVRPLAQLAEQVTGRAQGTRDVIAVTGAPREIVEVGREVDRLVDSLEAARRQQATAAADLAHGLKGPLARIRIALEAQADAITASARSAVTEIDRTVGELLEIARAEAGLPEEARAPVDLEALCTRVAAAREREVHVSGEGATLELAAASVERALGHLLDNAAAFAHERIELEVRADGFVVSDDGPGVPEALRPRLFSRFASRRTGGTGLGLAYVRAVAEAHGGGAELAPGLPTRFVIRLAPVHTAFTRR